MCGLAQGEQAEREGLSRGPLTDQSAMGVTYNRSGPVEQEYWEAETSEDVCSGG